MFDLAARVLPRSGTDRFPFARPRLSAQHWIAAALLFAFALVPIFAAMGDAPFYVTLMTRVMIFALAALGLNLILGYGGMVSFGHSVYLGIGAYAAGVLTVHGVHSAWLQLGAALLVGAAVAGVIGALSLRTTGIGFIMITLAFAQMFFFFCVGLRQYGGDDGMSLAQRSAFGLFDINDNTVLYYTVFVTLLLTLFGLSRMVASRFGMVLRGSKSNERRMVAIGFATYRYRWCAYVLSALICVLAGFLLANLTRYASPAYIQWTVSGELIVMVVLGGLGTLIGPVIGATVIVLFEEFISHAQLGLPGAADAFINDHWLGALGLFILIVALGSRRGLYGSLPLRSRGAQ